MKMNLPAISMGFRSFRGLADSPKLKRKIAAVAFVFCSAILTVGALVRSYYDERGTVQRGTVPSGVFLPEEFVYFRLTVLSVDEVNQIAEVRPQVISDWGKTGPGGFDIRLLRWHGMTPIVVTKQEGVMSGKRASIGFGVPLSMFLSGIHNGQSPPLPPNLQYLVAPAEPTDTPPSEKFLQSDYLNASLYFGPLRLRDIHLDFDLYGVAGFANLPPVISDAPVLEMTAPGPTYTTEPPPARTTELEIRGDPWLYPFDRYVLIGRIECNVLATLDGKEFVGLDVLQTDVDVRSQSFDKRDLSFDDLQQLHKPVPKYAGMQIIDKAHPESAQDKRNLAFGYLDRARQVRMQLFAVELRRPLFLRFFSVFLLIITVVSMAIYLRKSTMREFALQAAGYFVGLWAVRQILVSNGPKTFTLIDYAILFLYLALIVAMVAKAIYSGKVSQPTPTA